MGLSIPSYSLPNWRRELLNVIRLPFWFACFWAVIGVFWRSPLESVGLICIFLVLLIGLEWVSRRLHSAKLVHAKQPLEEGIQQQLVRSKTAEGLDRLDGTFLAEFLPDAATATVHIPFCPPFERVPRVHVYALDETDVHLRVASPKPYGVRVDVKRSDLELEQVCIAIVAESEAPQANACGS